METKNRILKNTVFLYIRSLFTLVLALYSSRLILEALGVEDFGVFQLVGGVVSAVSFLNSTMSGATQRYLSYEIGIGDNVSINKTFSMAVNIHLIFSFVIFLIIMIVGFYLLKNHLNIGNADINEVIWVLLFSSLSLVLSIMSVPYNSLLIAQENMSYFAYIDIIGAILKLGAVYLLFYFHSSRLVLYGFFLFVVSFIILLLYYLVCKSKYKSITYAFMWEGKLAKSMLSFSGWTSVAAFAYMIRTQGLSIILNIFFGPLLNAAIGISNQVNAAVRTFSQNFQMSFAPQIVKTYAKGDFLQMNKLISSGAKLSTYLIIFFSLPIILETEFVLQIWLKTVPPYAVMIIRLVLIETIVATLTCTGNQAIRATGNVKAFELTYNFFEILALPVILGYLYWQKVYYMPMVIIIVFMFVSSFVKLFFLNKMIQGFEIREYIKNVMFSTLIITLLSLIVPVSICSNMQSTFLRFVISSLSFESIFLFLIVLKGLNAEERILFKTIINKVRRK